MTIPELGNLEEVDYREAWPHEPWSFTPWLFENLKMLSSLPKLVTHRRITLSFSQNLGSSKK